ncbi:hypothetical protein [Bacillus cereus group sp. BfR-BA-01347]|uniref:hypothetical protein n=1 Tax=Bacillus cereus group sp. BfR-BA-01347 TaxID=2920310 RepID=UPI001F57E089|nr:hypothetical protein [Bacillus cereus group sp. BfR-BA-01347]
MKKFDLKSVEVRVREMRIEATTACEAMEKFKRLKPGKNEKVDSEIEVQEVQEDECVKI